jgi:DNA-binding NtrC family response regulator
MAKRSKQRPSESQPVRVLLVDDQLGELKHQAQLLLDARTNSLIFGDVQFELEVSNTAYFVADLISKGRDPWDVIVADVFMQRTQHGPNESIVRTAALESLQVAGHELPFNRFTPRHHWSSDLQADPEAGGLEIVRAIQARLNADKKYRPPKVMLVSHFGNSPVMSRVRELRSKESAWLDYRDKGRWSLKSHGIGLPPNIYVMAVGQVIVGMGIPSDADSNLGDRTVWVSNEMQTIEAQVQALGRARTRNVWITGERGVGRVTLARLLHRARSRSRGDFDTPWRDFSSRSTQEANFERVLFGQTIVGIRANEQREGVMQAAAGGTLVVKDIEHLKNPEQRTAVHRILRREPHVRHDGFEVDTSVLDLVVVTTTDTPAARGLMDQYADDDLDQELSRTLQVAIPPLRRRSRDIAALALEAIRDIPSNGRLSAEAVALLEEQEWRDGNINELVQVVKKAVLQTSRPIIAANDIRSALDATTTARRLEISRRGWAPAGVNQAAADSALDWYHENLPIIVDIRRFVLNSRYDTLSGIKKELAESGHSLQMSDAELEELRGGRRARELAMLKAAALYNEASGHRRRPAAIEDWIKKRNKYKSHP